MGKPCNRPPYDGFVQWPDCSDRSERGQRSPSLSKHYDAPELPNLYRSRSKDHNSLGKHQLMLSGPSSINASTFYSVQTVVFKTVLVSGTAVSAGRGLLRQMPACLSVR